MNSKSYRQLFNIPGAITFCAAAFLGRLPAGMIGISVILPISMLTGFYTTAGIVVAAIMSSMAVSAPLTGRLVDHYGQGKILLIFAAINFIGTLTLIACIQYDVILPLLCLAGVITGASRLSTGTMVRTRWAYVIKKTFQPERQAHMLQSAYAFESIIDEVVFICAPILATVLCTTVHPLAGLACCLLTYTVGAVALAMQHRTEPTVEVIHSSSSALSISALWVIFAAILFIGISAGALEVIVVARADHLGSRSFIGLLMAILAGSSMMAGFWYGARNFNLSAYSLWIRCLGLLVCALIPFAFASNLVVLAIALFIAGLLIAPTSISGQVLTQRLLPSNVLNEGMSLVVTGMILGMALGGWFSGVLIDKFDAYRAGALPALAAFAAFVIAMLAAKQKSMHTA